MPTSIRTAEAHEYALCLDIRIRVFVEEQGVPFDEEEDEWDPVSTHFLAWLEDRPVGTARLRITRAGQAKAERVAVLAQARGASVGRGLMDAVEAEARRLGHTEIALSAQTQALPFYERLGYVVEGDIYDEAGIPHRWMRKTLAT